MNSSFADELQKIAGSEDVWDPKYPGTPKVPTSTKVKTALKILGAASLGAVVGKGLAWTLQQTFPKALAAPLKYPLLAYGIPIATAAGAAALATKLLKQREKYKLEQYRLALEKQQTHPAETPKIGSDDATYSGSATRRPNYKASLIAGAAAGTVTRVAMGPAAISAVYKKGFVAGQKLGFLKGLSRVAAGRLGGVGGVSGSLLKAALVGAAAAGTARVATSRM